MEKEIQLAILWGGIRHGANFILEERCNFMAFDHSDENDMVATYLSEEDFAQLPTGVEELIYARINYTKKTKCGTRVSMFISGDSTLDDAQKRAITGLLAAVEELTLEELRDTELTITVKNAHTEVSVVKSDNEERVFH